MSKITGIDLGIINSCVSAVDGGECKVITNPEGNRTTPSAVAYKNSKRIIGGAVKRQVVTNKNTISSIKRLIGTNEKVELEGKQYMPQEASAMILQYLKSYAGDYLGEKIEKTVITVSTYFNDSQRQATRDIGKVAGLEAERTVSEPTTAILAHGIDKTKREQRVLVRDLGGGAFDVPILEFADGTFEILFTNGDTKLGGDDFDSIVIGWVADTLKKENGVDLCKDTVVIQRLKEAGGKAKRDLSGAVQTQIPLPFISAEADGPLHFEATLMRVEFDEMTKSLVECTVEPVRNVLRDAGLTKNGIRQVLLVSGSTHTPAVREAVKNILGKKPDKSINSDEVAVMDTAIQGGVIAGDVKDVLLLDVTPLSLGIETMGGVTTVPISCNITIPISKSQMFSMAADNQPTVDTHVPQGERPMASDNKELGMLELDGVAPAYCGVPQIEVTFGIDISGIVCVSAKDRGIGKEQSITIQNMSGLSDEGIDRMIRGAEEHKAEDEKRKEEVDLRSRAESFITQVGSTPADNGDRIDAKQKEETQKLHDDLQKSPDENDTNAVREKLGALERAAQATSTQMY